MITPKQIKYTTVAPPLSQKPETPVNLNDQTFAGRKRKVLDQMHKHGFDTLFIYGDREHGDNFGYLTGIEPRFEEAVYVLHRSGDAYLLLGNESLYIPSVCRTEVTGIHVPHFSLPNQPMHPVKTLAESFAEANITAGATVGMIGWKMFTSSVEDNCQLFDIPHFMVETVKTLVGSDGKILNAAFLLIDPVQGARVTMNANEIAHFEFGAALGSAAMLAMLTELDTGKREMDLAEHLAVYGQQTTVQTICAAGERFTGGIVAPRENKTRSGDPFSASIGYRGGLTVRKGYIAASEDDLPEGDKDYIEAIVKPYYAAAANWYETIGLAVTGGEIYDLIEQVVPKAQYGWHLNPGHLTASEEWLSSPVYPGSTIAVQSGMMFQMDIILKVPGHAGINAEDGVAIADEKLRAELAADYPEVWARIVRRREYMKNTLGIILKPEVLPLSDTEGWLSPLMLAKDKAMIVSHCR